MMRKVTLAGWGVCGLMALVAACGSADGGKAVCAPEDGGEAATAGTSGSQNMGGKGNEAGESGDVGGAGGEGGAGGDGTVPEGAVPALPSGFDPSNLPKDLDLAVEEDLIIDGETCASHAVIDTDKGEIRCYSPGLEQRHPTFAFKVVKQSDGSELAVFAGKNIVTAPTVQITVEGQRPLVLLAPGDITLRGSLYAIPDDIYFSKANAGGFSAPDAMQAKGLGPGGGGSTSTQAGGGAYCGKGGKGGSATGSLGGVAYGSPELVPLLGGSSGGAAATDAGAGGGAVQVVAGNVLTIAATGVIHVGGGNGMWGSSGAGSGGAILLEAPEISVLGTLAANGGGGGEGTANGDDGFRGSPDDVAAPGGNTGTASTDDDGGNGSAAAVIDGSPGGKTNGGGGGGAGRIRLNSTTGEAVVTGTFSPSLETECVSQGVLAG